jgi:polygalacturonase
MTFDIRAFGAIDDGLTDNAKAIQAAIDVCAASGGGRVEVPAGDAFLSGSLLLKAGVDLHLAAGSTLRASADYGSYSPEHAVDVITEGTVVESVLPRRSFIVGYRAHGASITGSGTLDGNGKGFILEPGPPMHEMRAPHEGLSHYLNRPFTVFLIDSDDVTMSGVRIIDPAFWAVRISGGTRIELTSLRIHTDLMVPNADGIDIDRSTRVRITNCDIVTADDCISLKANSGTAHFGPTADVIISGCVLTSASGAITLGCDAGDIRDVIITSCIIRDSHRGIAIRPREGGVIERVLVADCTIHTRSYAGGWWGNGEPLHVSAYAWEGPDTPHEDRGNPERQLPGAVRDVTIRDVTCRSGSGVVIWGQDSSLLSDVVLERVHLQLGEVEAPATIVDMRPCPDPQLVEVEPWAFDIRRATGVRLDRCSITWLGHADLYAGAVHVEDAPDFQEVGTLVRETSR